MNTPAPHPTPTRNGPQNGSQSPLSGPDTAATSGVPVSADGTDPAGLVGAELLDEVLSALRRYVILPSDHAAHAVTLWIAATHAQPAWAHAARLVIRAPEKRCGKSRLLDIVEALCWAPLITVNSSPSAIYRSITEDPPTLLVDEADAIFTVAGANEDLRGLLNAGHQRNRPAIRYDAATRQVEHIPTFAMAALAGIGAMPATIEDRAVIVRMRRRAPGESVAPYRFRRDRPGLAGLARDLHTWTRAAMKDFEAAAPAMPVEDRFADTWESLVVIADHAGGPWPVLARAAIVAMIDETDDTDQGSERIRLLIDIHTAFADEATIPTATLLERLRADAEAPWIDYGGPAGLTAKRLGLILGEFGIRSDTIRFPVIGQSKGYHRKDFSDTWSRYTPHLVDDSLGPDVSPVEAADPSDRPPRLPGGSVPSVPPSSSQVSPGTDRQGGTDRSVPGRPSWYGSIRTTEASVPPLTSNDEDGTDGTDPRCLRAVGGAR